MRKLLLILLISGIFPFIVQAQDTTTFTSENGALTFQYPAGWSMEEAAGMVFGDSGDGMMIMLYTPSSLESILLADKTQPLTNPAEVITLLANVPGAQPTEMIGEIENYTEGEYPTASAVFRSGIFDSLTMVIQVTPTEFVMIYGQAVQDTTDQYKPAFLAISDSISYSSASDIGEELEAAYDITVGEFPAPTVGEDQVVWQVQTLANGGANQFDIAKNLAVDSHDTIYVADGDNGLLIFNADGVLTNAFYTSLWLEYVSDVAYQEDWGRIYFADQSVNTIVASRIGHIMTNEVHMSSYGHDEYSAYAWGALSPHTLDAGTGDWLYAYDQNVDASGNPIGRIVVYSRYRDDGDFGFMFSYDLPADFADGALVEIAPGNKLIVANTERVLIYDAEGNLLFEDFASDIIGGAVIQAVTTDQSSNIFIATTEKLLKFDVNGSLISEMALPYYADMYTEIPVGKFHHVNDLVVLSNGDVVIADTNESYIQLTRLKFN